ncbi:MAG: hypothetical protein RJA99_3174 [Pseudomonadota bacterium]|jgi:hypothetical protein
MGWSGSPPPPDPRVGEAIDKQSELAKQQFDWSKQVYERDYLPAMQRDAALREQLQDAYLGSMRKQDEYADYQFGRYKDLYAPLEDDLVSEAKRGIDIEGRVNRGLADFSQQSSLRNQQMMREANRNNMGNGTAMAYAMAANKNADALGAAGLGTNIRAAAEGENFARKASVAGMGRGLVMDTGNFMQGANAAGGAAGGNSAQGMGIMGQGNDFMRGGYGMSGSMYGNAGNLAMGLSNYNMQGYQAQQQAIGGAMSAVGSLAGMAVGGPMGAAVGGKLFGPPGGKANGGLIQKYADGGEVMEDAYDPRSIAEMQVNSVMGYKSGGPVARPPKMRPGSTTQSGGKVSGPGGPKDDRVPALLSDGEFVMPVGTVKKFGIDKLEKMRQAGLEFEKQLGIGRA